MVEVLNPVLIVIVAIQFRGNMLAFYDENYEVFSSDPLRTVHNGFPGGADDKLIFIRNNDSSNYYTDLVVSYTNSTSDDYGLQGSTGWAVKFLYGRRQPTEQEWDNVRAGQSIALPAIGNTLAADTYTYHPIWVRVYCPGGSAAQIREGQTIQVFFSEKKVGA